MHIDKRRIGFVGLGIMGSPMCRNLLKAGYAVTVYNRSAGAIAKLADSGAVAGKSLQDIAAHSDIVITMLPDGPEVEEVVLGPGGLLERMRPGSTVIDMSSVSPIVAQKIGAACAVKGVRFLDAPVSGGEPKAIEGTLAVMAGGEKSVFDDVFPVLQSMATSVTHTGPVGAGNFTKLANQMIVACNIAAMGEAFVLAANAGLDPAVVFHAIKGGLAGSTVLNAKAPMVIGRNFAPGFRIRLHQKDLRNALSAAESMKIALPLTSVVQQMLLSLIAQGKGDLDHSAIVQFAEQLAGTEIKERV